MYWNMPDYQIARDKAAEILKMIPYDPEEMIRTNDIIKAVEKKLNVDVKFTKFDFAALNSGGRRSSFARCGAMMYISNGKNGRKAAILLNEKETPEMVRFSLVHELGHLVTTDWDALKTCHVSMHVDMDITSIPDKLLKESKDNDAKHSYLVNEQIANIFALLVLIPYDSLMKAISKYKSIEAVAEFFGVERNAVVSRLMLESKVGS